VAKRILEGLEAQFSIQGRDVFVTASIGIAMTIDHREDPHSLIRDADTAMYRAKGRGKASFVIFDRSMNELAVERLELESDLRTAVENGQFTLRYQPIVDIETSELKEVEVLLRWQHPTRGMVSPVTFIPIAEETGLICPIGLWVLREACAQLSLWRRGFKHYRDLGISVNVSARQFYSVDFVKKVEETLNEFGIEPNRVKLEVTETAMLSDLDRVTVVFDQLRAMGVRIAIDDFGTGYSSMAYLSRLPVDTLKIDRSFVSTLGGDARIDGVVRAMIAMARTLGLDVTSEGIETDEQLTVLRSLGCDSGQEYLFARPLTALGVAQYLSAPRHEPLYRSAA
jgi:EAL domain-containing protein (putative c-di-GMP-specific phosphodiesterase class I)